MTASKYAMQSVAYYILNYFQEITKLGFKSVPQLLEDIGYEEYHNFWKVRLPFQWYCELLETLDLDKDDLLVEVARIKGNHAKDLHYHKISHAICIVLGETTGFPNCHLGTVVKDWRQTRTEEDLECYFPVGCHHTFHGGLPTTENIDGSLYFISIQSPPLLTENNDDFYRVLEKDDCNKS